MSVCVCGGARTCMCGVVFKRKMGSWFFLLKTNERHLIHCEMFSPLLIVLSGIRNELISPTLVLKSPVSPELLQDSHKN